MTMMTMFAFATATAHAGRHETQEFDVAEPSDAERGAHVASCLAGHFDTPHSEQVVAEIYASCARDIEALQLDKLDKTTRTRGKRSFDQIDAWKKKRAELEADKNWKRLFDAYDAGYDAWLESAKAHADVLAGAAELQRAVDGDAEQAKGCSAKAATLVGAQLAAVKPKTLDEVRKALEDPITYPAYRALIACTVVDKLGAQAAAMTSKPGYDKNSTLGFRVEPVHGPRAAGAAAANAALAKILADNPKFGLRSFGRGGSSWREDIEMPAHLAVTGTHPYQTDGTVATVKPQKDGKVLVTFKTETLVHDTETCVDTKTIQRIDANGDIEYQRDCRVTGTEKEKVTPLPIFVDAAFAAGVKPGRLVTYVWTGGSFDKPGTQEPGAIMMIWTDAKKKTLAGWGGFAW
jgi:hypothetical protein